MRRPPKPGEWALTHFTENTGDSQVFALSDDNYDPQTIGQISETTFPNLPLAHWTISVLGKTGFALAIRGRPVSRNLMRRTADGIRLSTRLLSGAESLSKHELEVLADCAQCVAVALIRARSL
jgi:hypothetical protein